MLLTIFQIIQATKNRCFVLVFLCFFFSLTTSAQNLITNGDFESGGNGIGFQINGSGYNLISAPFSGSTSSGNYAFTADPKPINTANFITSQDHTSGAGSLMMVIDGNTTGGQQRFWKAGSNGGGICGLKLGITYTFSYWIQSVSTTVTGPSTQADIGISFNNANSVTLVSGSALAPLPALGWRKVVYTFVPTNACVNIELYNNNTNPVGNDFAVDDFSLTAPLTITSVTKSPVSCPQGTDGSININIYGGLGPYTYNLTGTATVSSTIGTFLNLAAGNYNVSVTDAELKTVNWPTVINITAPLDDIAITATGSTSICVGNSVKLDASGGYGNYTWSPSTGLNTTSGGSVIAAPNATRTYTLTSDNGVSGSELIVNGGFESGSTLTGFTTQYTSASASTTDTSSSRQYYISGSTLNLSKDFVWGCVPNTGSNMFMGDSDSNANTEILKQTVTVLPNTNYQISYFIQSIGVFGSINDPNPSNLEVYINGVLITSLINNTAGCNWRKVTGIWNSGIAVSAIIIIKNSTVAGTGNDFAIDDISFKGLNCIQTKTIEITVSTGSSDTAFTYPTPVCQSATSTLPVITNPTTFSTPGTWTKDSGVGTLSINSLTGEINPSLSTPGTYIVKYAVPLVGCQPASFSTFSITISPQANAGSDGSTTVCDNSSSAINLSSLITGQQTGGVWSRNTGTGGIFNAIAGTFTPIAGAKSSTFTYTITGSVPCPNDASVATVTVNPILTPIISCGTSTTSSVQFTWTAVTNATSYNVSYTINAAPAVVIGSIGNVLTYTVNSLTSGDNVIITVTPVGGVGICFSSNTQSCAASNCILPTASISYASSPFCISNITPQPVTLTGTGAYTTGSYSAVGLIINSSTGSITPSVNTAGSYTITYTILGIAGCPSVISTTPIVIKAQPDSGADGSISVCEDDTTVINLFNLITGEQAGGVWTRTTGSGGNFNSGAGTFTPLTGAATSTFTYTLDNAPCNDSSIATVTINPLPVLTITCGTATGNSVSFNWNSIADAISYSYSYSIDSGVPISGVLPSTSTTLTVNGLTPGQNVSIILTPTGSVCGKQAISNCVSSNCPTPIVDAISDFPSCANDNVAIPIFTSVTSGVTFNWTNNNTSIGIAASGSGALIPNFNVINTTAILQTATISVTANDGTCTGPAMIFSLDVNPLPTVTISATQNSVCSGSATTINFNGTPNATVTYTVDSGANQFLVLDSSGNATLSTGNLTTNTIYSLVSVLNPITNCSQTQTGTVTITINALPTVTISGTTAVCSGSGTPISFNGTPNAIVTYTVNSGVNQTILLDVFGQATLPSGNLIANSDYSLVSIVDTNSCSKSQIGNATISVDALPTVTISGTGSICSGTGTSINFNGTPNTVVTYSINSGTNQTVSIDASGNASLPTGNLTSDALYSLVSVQDLITTCFQTQSGTANLRVISLPTATISGATTICLGTGTSIQFSGTPDATVTYTINSGINQTVNLDATGKADLLTGNLIVATDYSLVSIDDSTKTCSQTLSGTATISINLLPTVTISTSSPICTASASTVEFIGTPNAIVTYKVNSGTNQTINLDTLGQASLSTGNLISNTIYILVSVSDFVTSCSQLQSGSAPITVTPLPIVAISGTTSICSGASTLISFNGTPNATVTYTIDSGTNQIIVLDSTGKATLPTGNLTSNTIYSLVSVSDTTTTCSQLQTGTATISINAAPDVVPATIAQSICSGQSSGVLLTSTTSGTIFNWTVIESGVTGAFLGTGNNISQVLNTTSPINLGTAEYTVTPTANGCSGLPVVITVSVSPTPTAVATPDKDIICSGETTAIALSSGNSQTTFSWNAIQNNVTGGTQDSGNTIVQVLQTSKNNFGEAVYAITPSLNGCIGLTILVPITVNPVPNVSTNVFNNPICSGTATNIDLTSNVPGTTYSWSVVQTNVIGAVSGTGNAIAQIIETTGNSIGIAAYTITPQINSCIGNPIIVPIQVNPTPEVFGPSSTTICSGESPKISLIPLIIGTSFTWTHLSNKVTGASDGNGDEIDQILVAENSLGKVEYTVTPSFKDCSGTPIVIAVDVNPAPSVILESGVLCLEVDRTLKNSLILDTNLSTNSYDFEWFFNNSISPISGAIGSTFEAKELGDYYVNVRFKSTGCSIKSNTSTVTEVNPTNSFNVIVSDAFTEVATITVTGQNGITTYLYQIDDGALQTSNVFSGIGAGTYTIRVTDSDGCTDYSEDVLVIDYPKYFTPNGDGFNDIWNIKGLSDQNNTKLLIYDRYGKLLKQISPKGQGWDGTYNGVQLPAADYWFTVDYVEPNNNLNNLFKAHFSLKR